jgi:cytochrome c peroxidase
LKSRTAIFLVIAIVFILVALWWRMPHPQETVTQAKPPVRPVGAVVEIKAPLGLPPVPVPADNPPTAETIELGRRLYYDPMLSADNTISCASCHKPEAGFADDHSVSSGVNQKTGARNSPTVANSAYWTTQFWDGRSATLEKQAEGPVANPVEMAHTLAGVEKKLMAEASYREAFKKAFGSDQITYEMVEKAIASFERTVLIANSPFDRFQYGGDKKALSPAAQRGMKVFMDEKKGNCAVCHTIGQGWALFTDNQFHNIGIGADTKGNLADLGRYEVTKNDADRGAFRTPTLRNCSRTAPYMHDGSLKTLKEVVDYYIGGGNTNPQLSKHMKPLDTLTFEERADLVAFLESLTGEMPPNVGPPETTKPVASAKP